MRAEKEWKQTKEMEFSDEAANRDVLKIDCFLHDLSFKNLYYIGSH